MWISQGKSSERKREEEGVGRGVYLLRMFIKLGELKRVQSTVIISIACYENKNMFIMEKTKHQVSVFLWDYSFSLFVPLVRETQSSKKCLKASQIL